ncbi:MAG: hypothetical protein CMK09_14855 [Ponticaulis sp.]|nr:hypothetical protein [Ponticaulis sp.]|tara:strand:+ start:23055 stop:23915 length:861 start_codon:yes stop_codon:yes gene_type:complete
MKLTALINSNSGSVPADGAAQLEALMKERGWPCHILAPDPGEFPNCLSKIDPDACDALIVWGGDGTVAAAMQKTGPDGPPIIPLPGGTMNMLHQRVHGGLADWQTCLIEAVLRRRIDDMPAACVGDEMIFVGAMFGRLTGLAQIREAVRKWDLMSFSQNLDLPEKFDLTSDILFTLNRKSGTAEGCATTLAVFVTEDRTKQEDGLDVISSEPRTLGELAHIGMQALLNPLTNADGITHYEADRIEVSFGDRVPMPATLDGEPVELTENLQISYLPKAARVYGAGLS